jgi:hypothetical protein
LAWIADGRRGQEQWKFTLILHRPVGSLPALGFVLASFDISGVTQLVRQLGIAEAPFEQFRDFSL